jgi:hypothetical protein
MNKTEESILMEANVMVAGCPLAGLELRDAAYKEAEQSGDEALAFLKYVEEKFGGFLYTGNGIVEAASPRLGYRGMEVHVLESNVRPAVSSGTQLRALGACSR